MLGKIMTEISVGAFHSVLSPKINNMPKAKERDIRFEDSMAALEKIVAQLESGDLPLERALELFEEGVGLARRCQSQLEEAERKVELLLRERGEIKAIPFELMQENQTDTPDRSAQFSLTGSGVVAGTGEGRNNEDEDDDLDDSTPF
jgi:exodeoxyribonuclease VII small subunit